MHVIGTAGHVDHGKSALVKALTGMDPDRLAEEKARQMTIDLGFAWLRLPSGEEVGIVDVPGHVDFIRNMLAGVGGIDVVLLVVAADEGVMPQTREHVAILDLLDVRHGVVAITKIDLVDEEWLALVEEDVTSLLRGTSLEGAPLVPVSAVTGQGLPHLLHVLTDLLDRVPPRPDLGRPRLPVDRVFTMSGFGTVVTGTLVDGSLAVGEHVVILPKGVTGRIRGLQSHKQPREHVSPGQRVAINLAGVDKETLQRGDVVTLPDLFSPTHLVDVRIRWLPTQRRALKHNEELHLFVAATEVPVRVRLIGRDTCPPGEETWAQLVLSRPVVVARGDRFVLRRPSPGETVGGGVVLNPYARRKYRRFREETLRLFRLWDSPDPGDAVTAVLHTWGPLTVGQLQSRGTFPPRHLSDLIAAFVARGGRLICPPREQEREARENAPKVAADCWLFSAEQWEKQQAALRSALAAYHQTHPLRAAMPREEARSRVADASWPPWLFDALIADATEAGWLQQTDGGFALTGHRPTWPPEQERAAQELLNRFRAQPFTPPTWSETVALAGEPVVDALVAQGTLVRVSPGILFLRETYDEMVDRVTRWLEEHGEITVAQARDLFGSSRKYMLAFLEHLDAYHITRRVGEVRVKGPKFHTRRGRTNA